MEGLTFFLFISLVLPSTLEVVWPRTEAEEWWCCMGGYVSCRKQCWEISLDRYLVVLGVGNQEVHMSFWVASPKSKTSFWQNELMCSRASWLVMTNLCRLWLTFTGWRVLWFEVLPPPDCLSPSLHWRFLHSLLNWPKGTCYFICSFGEYVRGNCRAWRTVHCPVLMDKRRASDLQQW